MDLGEIRLENGIKGRTQILGNLERAREIIAARAPEKIFLAGGDCGTELAPVSYLNKLYRGDLAVVWFDAHADLNSPATSATGNFHGMPLRCLLGDGDEALVKGCFSTLSPGQVIMAGLREPDPPEEAYIRDQSISCLSVEDLVQPVKLADLIRQKGYRNVYAHIDLDVLYPEKYPWVQCPAPGGLEVAGLLAILGSLNEQVNLAGASILELRPAEDMDIRPLRELVECCDRM